MKKHKQPSPVELTVWEGAYSLLNEQRPEMLRLVSVLVAGGQTPAQIFAEVTKRSPANSVWPGLCSSAADWIIYQKQNN